MRAQQGDVITTIFGILVGAMALGQMAPGVSALGLARVSAFSVFETINRVPPIDSGSTQGEKPQAIQGRLEFKEVSIRSQGCCARGEYTRGTLRQ